MTGPLKPGDIEQLGDIGYFICTGWLGAPLAEETRQAAHALEGFSPAKLGRGADRQARPELRGDELRWLTRAEAPAGLLAALETLRDELNSSAFLGLERLELQCARYLEPGALYAPHRDSFRGQRGRRVTCIYYLNEGWTPAHGGRLRLHVSPAPVEIDPCLDTLVVFLSERVEHEVSASFAARWALTAWFSGPEV